MLIVASAYPEFFRMPLFETLIGFFKPWLVAGRKISTFFKAADLRTIISQYHINKVDTNELYPKKSIMSISNFPCVTY